MDSSHTLFSLGGIQIAPGETRAVHLKASESFLSGPIQIPVTVIRGNRAGPTCFVCAAIHGDELNGVDIVRRLIFDIDHRALFGTLIAIPVVNIPGFLNQSRYLQYHRDLNRFFPGKQHGNNAERFAFHVFHEVVMKCHFGIDLHTAAVGKMNLPHIRGDMSHPEVKKLAHAFGSTILMDETGVAGSLRKEATDRGIPTILFEAGETGKFSKKISLIGLQGVLNVLSTMKMWKPRSKKKKIPPPFQVIVKESEWIRADRGGILDLAVRPGDLVYAGDLLGSILNPFGKTVTHIRTDMTGIVVGICTAPQTIPGTSLVHIVHLKKTLSFVERALSKKGV